MDLCCGLLTCCDLKTPKAVTIVPHTLSSISVKHAWKPVNNCNNIVFLFSRICLSMESESVCAKSVNQRIGVSGIATAFRIISRFCLNRIWLEKLNQLCPRITGMTLEKRPEHWQLCQSLPITWAPWGSSSATKPKLGSWSAPLLSWYLDF